MKDRVVEILVFLMSEIQENKQLQEIDLSQLRDQGYTTSEISAAFSWLYENSGQERLEAIRSGKAGTGSRRIFHEVEKAVVSTNAQGYLIQLNELGLIDDRQTEMILERALSSGYAGLTVQEVRDIVATVLSSGERPAGTGGHSMLNNEETIH
jgi:uncharacterized protein Smg (DUF494 family)